MAHPLTTNRVEDHILPKVSDNNFNFPNPSLLVNEISKDSFVNLFDKSPVDSGLRLFNEMPILIDNNLPDNVVDFLHNGKRKRFRIGMNHQVILNS